MKVLVVFDSVSATKMTEKVANIIADTMKVQGLDVDCLNYRDVSPASTLQYDCIVVGSPTMGWKPTKEISQFLGSLSSESMRGRSAAAFDTQIQSKLSGNATKSIEAKLGELGLKLISPPLISYVENKNHQYQMKDGELEKAKLWATELAKSLPK